MDEIRKKILLQQKTMAPIISFALTIWMVTFLAENPNPNDKSLRIIASFIAGMSGYATIEFLRRSYYE